MKPEDVHILDCWFTGWIDELKKISSINKIVLLSPAEGEILVAKKHFKGAQIICSNKNEWNLNNKCPYKNVDLVFACNVFMYCNSSPQIWLDNILNSSKLLVMQDLIRGWRMKDAELGDDGDSSRFCYGDKYKARIKGAFDLKQWDNKSIDVMFYEYVQPYSHLTETNLSFIGCFKQ
jgi:hypothetical protein